jgi:CelD/BcsL family acetyltransferase involved in cellulose biosynthesis
VRIHDSWSTKGFSLPPVAPRTGPFPRRAFLETWWRHRDPEDDARLAIIENETGLLALVDDGATLRFCGPARLTDYHSPLGAGAADLLARAGRSELRGRRLVLNSLPAEGVEVITSGLASAGLSATTTNDEITAVLALPASFDGWLANMPKKDRHEIRRKLRRFAAEYGEPELVRTTDADALADFVVLHRTAPGEKGEFMTARMESFFRVLLTEAGAVLDLLVARNRVYAASFGFEDEEGYYAYNAAYDRDAAASSPGIVLMAAVVAAQINRAAEFIDLLKGAEEYKFRLGAHARPLATVESDIE